MTDIIIIHNRPSLGDLLKSHLYKKIKSAKSMVLEDFKGHKAICTLNDTGELEYIKNYLGFDPILFANTLRSRFNAYWIEQSDLLEYNKYAFNGRVDHHEYLIKLDFLAPELNVQIKNQMESKDLWEKLDTRQRAKALPKGYLKNYLQARPVDRRHELDLLQLFDDCLNDRLSFGIPKN